MRYFMVELPAKLHRKRKNTHDFEIKSGRALFNKKGLCLHSVWHLNQPLPKLG